MRWNPKGYKTNNNQASEVFSKKELRSGWCHYHNLNLDNSSGFFIGFGVKQNSPELLSTMSSLLGRSQ